MSLPDVAKPTSVGSHALPLAQTSWFASTWLAVGALLAFAACGSGSDNNTQRRVSASSCKTVSACMKECAAGTTTNACQLAGQKKCALDDGKRCKDIGIVHKIFAQLLDQRVPVVSARHKLAAKDHLDKACSLGQKDACEQPQTSTVGPRTALPLRKPPSSQKKILPLRVVERLRRRGSRDISAPNSVKQEMRRNGDKQIIVSIKVCINRFGNVFEQVNLTPSQYMEYELKLRRKIKRWRFRPYVENGRRYDVCAVFTFIYRLP